MTFMKRLMAVLAAGLMILSMAGCAKKEKIVGTWKIDWILVQPEENGNSDYADRETNASLFESEQSYYKFNADGTAVHHMEDGGGAVDIKGTWKKIDDTTFQYEDEQGMSMEIWYVVSEDSLHVEWYSENPDDPYYNICYAYKRA